MHAQGPMRRQAHGDAAAARHPGLWLFYALVRTAADVRWLCDAAIKVPHVPSHTIVDDDRTPLGQ